MLPSMGQTRRSRNSAREPGDVVKLQELLRHARRAARDQRAEFARRGLDEFVRRDKERKEGSTSARDQRINRPPTLGRSTSSLALSSSSFSPRKEH